jgi:hypothetical protein
MVATPPQTMPHIAGFTDSFMLIVLPLNISWLLQPGEVTIEEN